MTLIKKIKGNIFLVLVLLAYIVMFFLRPEMGITAVKNSGYYVKEMLLIMPVIFVLTALLDLWVPKGKIMKYLGKESKTKGIILALVLGSISAGPIYAAFPMCVMLHKKGASIRNLVIILSSWAVIKVPMLFNEIKYLGIKFMAIRWVLTVLAILMFSWITSKIVHDDDLPTQESVEHGVFVNRKACMGCTLCVKKYPEVFTMKENKAYVKKVEVEMNMEKISQVIKDCPVQAITYAK